MPVIGLTRLLDIDLCDRVEKRAIAFLDSPFEPSNACRKETAEPNYPLRAPNLRRHESVIAMSERTLLVVEDDFVQRRQLVRALEGLGYRVFQASNGLQAIRLLDARKIHLVLTDIRMPFVDGVSLLKYVKTFFPHIPVVVATAYPGEMEAPKPDALLCKPFGPDKLVAWVQRLLQQHAS